MHRAFWVAVVLSALAVALPACPEDDCYVVRKCPTSSSQSAGGTSSGGSGGLDAGGNGGEGNAAVLPKLAVGYDSTCASIEGTVWCWGDNQYGQLGDGTTSESHSPNQVVGLAAPVLSLSASTHVCAVVEGGLAVLLGV